MTREQYLKARRFVDETRNWSIRVGVSPYLQTLADAVDLLREVLSWYAEIGASIGKRAQDALDLTDPKEE